MQFKPNFDLIRMWGEICEMPIKLTPFIAVFRRDGKTLVYIGDKHAHNISFDMVDMCFADDFEIKPDVLLTEMENAGYERNFSWYGLQDNTLAYAAGVATKKKLPVVFADLSDAQGVEVLRMLRPGEKIDVDFLDKILRTTTPNAHGTELEKLHAEFDKYGRDAFMIQNIAAALNKYNTVFCIFGTGHYAQQQLALEDMMGKPEYITKAPNVRGDFSKIKIKPEKLVEFKSPVKNKKSAVLSFVKGKSKVKENTNDKIKTISSKKTERS